MSGVDRRAAMSPTNPLREALEFYAASVNYAPQNPPGTGGGDCRRDVARAQRDAARPQDGEQ